MIAGCGVPPFADEIIAELISPCEAKVKKARPYLRCFILPFNDDGSLALAANSETFEGTIIARVASGSLRMRHQRYFLNQSELQTEEWRPLTSFALVVWVNEFYRILKPVPVDTEDCMTLWAIENFGDADVLDFSEIARAFPEKCRDGHEKANLLCGWYN